MRQSIVFKEWMPDKPELGGDYLTNAKNVIASPNGYLPFKTLDTSGPTLTASSVSGVLVSGGATKFDNVLYVASGGDFFSSNNGGAFTARGTASATLGAPDLVAFVQFGDLIIANAESAIPKKHTLNSTSNFSTLAASGTAPAANVAGIINKFLVFGNLGTASATASPMTTFPSDIQWSAIDDPTNWPTPNSDTAIATQSGYQEMDARYGPVTGIHGGDQHGVVLQSNAVTRMTYVGPPVVFQFDTISNDVGNLYLRSSIKVGSHTYFYSKSGFCRTDGVGVERIGSGKVDKFFAEASSPSNTQFMASYDPLNKLVMWAYPTSAGSSSTCNRLLAFNIETGGWTYADVTLETLVTPGSGLPSGSYSTGTAMAFNSGSSMIVGKFQGTAGSAIFETTDAEFNPGGRAYVDGIKPSIESTGTAPAMTTRIGTRDSLGSSVSYSAATSANSSTGFVNFRADAKYHRAEITITGNFERTTGFVANVQGSGDR